MRLCSKGLQIGDMMTTKTKIKCYRFEGIDFIPENRQLRWHDNQQTLLTDDESRFLASLCYLAGEVVSTESIYRYTFTSLTPTKKAEITITISIFYCYHYQRNYSVTVKWRYLSILFRVMAFEYRCLIPHPSVMNPATKNPIFMA